MTVHDVREELIRAYPWIKGLYPPRHRCRVRILMVADGFIDFGSGAFGLSEMVSAVAVSDVFWVVHEITTAHRGSGVADLPGFRFDRARPAVSVGAYDQVWLFGSLCRDGALTADERRTIAAFMNAGGGVFAAGEVEGLGAALCAGLPRLRTMRSWSGSGAEPAAPEGGGASLPPEPCWDRAMAAGEPAGRPDDEGQGEGEAVRPLRFPTGGTLGWCEHPVLRGLGRSTIHLRHHRLGGECLAPSSPAATYDLGGEELPEYPLDVAGGRPVPQVIATLPGASGSPPEPPKAPAPHPFGAIGAYDGHRAHVGRIVVDATWHHFLNLELLNLRGAGPGDDPDGDSTRHQQARRYARNIASWLSPARLQQTRTMKFTPVLRYLYPLLEELRPRSPGERLLPAAMIGVGRLAEATVSRLMSPADATELAVVLAGLGGPLVLANLLDPWRSPSGPGRDQSFVATIRHAIVGGVLHAVARELPASPSDAPARVESIGLDGVELIVGAGVGEAVETVVAQAREQRDLLSSLIDQLA